MTPLELAAGVVSVLLSIAFFFTKRLISQLEDKQLYLEREVAGIKENYLHKTDFREFKVELRSMFEEIKTDIRSLPKH